MKIEKLSLGALQTNCYIISKDNHSLIIDPSAESTVIEKKLKEQQTKPLAILLTHAHFDHIGALEDIREKYQIPVYIQSEEQDWLIVPNLNGSSKFGFPKITCKKAENELMEKNYSIGPFHFYCRFVPGHSPGSVAFIFEKEEVVFAGDCLFKEGIGRTDLHGGSFDQIYDSIHNQLFTLPNQYTVFPGHGMSTTIGHEKVSNPFV
jgi:hydroxyacylglutathione hydrolase